MNEMKVIIAGSRGFMDAGLMAYILSGVMDRAEQRGDVVKTIISGMAQGADRHGWLWARKYGISCLEMPADWQQHGRRAGYLRNVEMAQQATHCIIFWNGSSPGSRHMIRIARNHGLKVMVVYYTEEQLRITDGREV